MKIRPKIPIYLMGNKIIAPLWYIDRYGGRTALLGWNLDKRYNYANSNLNLNDHRNAGDLNTVFRKNSAYTSTPGAISSDIQAFYNSDANGMSAEDFVKFYNENAEKIRSHWNLDRTYNASTAGDHNRLFRRMFLSRSNQQESPGSDYNIGYQEGKTKGGYDIQDIEGSSTWLRRMDLYENEFDPNNPDSSRLHEITLKDGTKATVYKKANGDIALLPESPNTPPSLTPQLPQPELKTGSTEIGGGLQDDKKQTPGQGNGLLERLRGMIPGLLATGRLAGNLINNARVYDEALKGIRPTLLLPYYTHRQVVGDEATKQAYYRRAAAGLTKAAQPFTSDADRQMAYMLEARRVGDELRAQGDLADNQEIRRTSDESNQHQWANTQRATEVANTNLASLNDANEKKHTLLALKHSAQWSSIDNYLKEIETRKRLLMEEDNAYANQIHALAALDAYENDEEYLAAYENLKKLGKVNPTTKQIEYDITDPNVKAALKALRTADINRQKRMLLSVRDFRLRNRTLSIKSGSKITYKKDDKLLYKSTKDVVDHFRRMCRRYPEKERKILPLAPHPDGTRRRKYQVGGQFLAPFTIYTPAVGVGESSRTVTLDTGTSSKSSSSSKDNALKDMLDLIKMFKDVKGIKVDVSSIYSTIAGIMQEAEVFGKELNSQLIATMYLRAMLQLNNVSRSKEIYDKAYEVAAANGALNEVAVNSVGLYAVLNKETKEINFVEKIDPEKHTPLTNSLLLTLREFSPNLAFEKGDEIMLQVVANGIGLSKINLEIKNLAGSLGSSDLTIEGLTKVESDKIKSGLRALTDPLKVRTMYALESAPDGDYKYTTETENQINLMKLALDYISNNLPENYKAVLKMHGGVKENILTFLGSLMSTTEKFEISPLSGKAASSSKKGSSDEGSDMTPAMALSMGLGERESFVISDKTSDGLKVYAVNLPLLDLNHHAMATATLNLVGSGDYAGLLLLNSATMGGVKVSSEGINDILISEGRIHAAELPIDMAAYLSTGVIKPDLNFLKNIEKADELVRQAGITNRDNLTAEQIKIINNIYSKNNLPIIYTINGDGKPILTSEYRRFALMKATAPLTVFEEDVSLANDGLVEATDDDRTRFEAMMKLVTGNEKYSLDNGISIWGIGRLSGTDLYKGTIYIPMTESHISALASTGFKASPEEYNQIDALDLLALFIRSSGFKSAGSFTK